jgi:hypothetical protein
VEAGKGLTFLLRPFWSSHSSEGETNQNNMKKLFLSLGLAVAKHSVPRLTPTVVKK